MHQKSDHLNNSTVGFEYYNKQLIKYLNLHAKLQSSYVLNRQKYVEVLQALPKEETFVQIHKQTIDLIARQGYTQLQVKKMRSELEEKIAILEEGFNRISQISEGQRSTQGRLDADQMRVKAVIDSLATQMNEQFDTTKEDMLNKLISHVESMKDEEGDYIGTDKDADQRKIEVKLREHIQEKLRDSHSKIEEQLGSDDIIDYILVIALSFVAIGGVYFWRKVKTQEKQYIL